MNHWDETMRVNYNCLTGLFRESRLTAKFENIRNKKDPEKFTSRSRQTIAFLPVLLRAANCKTHYDEVTSYEASLASMHSYVRNPRRFLVSRHEIGSFAREFATVFVRFRNRGNSYCRGIRCSFLLLARFCRVSHARRNFEPRVGATLANASGNETPRMLHFASAPIAKRRICAPLYTRQPRTVLWDHQRVPQYRKENTLFDEQRCVPHQNSTCQSQEVDIALLELFICILRLTTIL